MKVFLGFITAVVLMALVGLGVVQSGLYNVSAAEPQPPVIAWTIGETLRNSIERRSGILLHPTGLRSGPPAC